MNHCARTDKRHHVWDRNICESSTFRSPARTITNAIVSHSCCPSLAVVEIVPTYGQFRLVTSESKKRNPNNPLRYLGELRTPVEGNGLIRSELPPTQSVPSVIIIPWDKHQQTLVEFLTLSPSSRLLDFFWAPSVQIIDIFILHSVRETYCENLRLSNTN